MNNNKPMGFNGISSLVSKLDLTSIDLKKESLNGTSSSNDTSYTNSTTSNVKKGTTENKSKENNGINPWFWFFVLLLILGAMFLAEEYDNTNDYSKNENRVPETKITPTTKKENNTNSKLMVFSMPSPGTNNVLVVSELRWCLREQIILNTYDSEVNFNQASEVIIEKYNQLVNRYNTRCGSYRYYEGQLTKAKIEILAIKDDIQQSTLNKINPLNMNNYNVDLTKYDVLDVQSALKMRGYDVGTVDGIMGNRTRNAIKQFQRDYYLKVDGEISPKLLEYLQIR
ncbi:peptidoglycan-binding domain-containing protein [Vibrio rumoiensis]|uniref:peptidoglycan-binding domain-containing protein n=1 Tax=Vibrio rumoiensis TaxID=76258 RepID=UPI001E438A5C|nr:peptidoglycan-binding domain-containing protein [Vibrio rumoiensis]